MQSSPMVPTAGPGGPYAVACEKLWRLIEQLVLRQGRLEVFLNEVATHVHGGVLPHASDLPISCRELLSFAMRKIDSKWTFKDVEYGPATHEYSFDGLDEDEARDIAKAIVDLTFVVTVENMRSSGTTTGGTDA